MEPDRPPASRPSPARGVVLIAVAVVLGLFLLRAMDDNGASSAADGATEVTDDADGTDDGVAGDEGAGDGDAGDANGADGEDAAPEPPPLRPAGEITVLVLNGSGVQGAAAAQSETIAGAGYQMAVPGNAPQEVAATQVQFAEGYEGEARRLAEEIGASGDAIAPMGDLGETDLQGAQLVVLLGTDLVSP